MLDGGLDGFIRAFLMQGREATAPGAGATAFTLLKFAGEVMANALSAHPRRLGILVRRRQAFQHPQASWDRVSPSPQQRPAA